MGKLCCESLNPAFFQSLCPVSLETGSVPQPRAPPGNAITPKLVPVLGNPQAGSAQGGSRALPGEGWLLGRNWAVWAGAGKEQAGSGQGAGREWVGCGQGTTCRMGQGAGREQAGISGKEQAECRQGAGRGGKAGV